MERFLFSISANRSSSAKYSIGWLSVMNSAGSAPLALLFTVGPSRTVLVIKCIVGFSISSLTIAGTVSVVALDRLSCRPSSIRSIFHILYSTVVFRCKSRPRGQSAESGWRSETRSGWPAAARYQRQVCQGEPALRIQCLRWWLGQHCLYQQPMRWWWLSSLGRLTTAKLLGKMDFVELFFIFFFLLSRPRVSKESRFKSHCSRTA